MGTWLSAWLSELYERCGLIEGGMGPLYIFIWFYPPTASMEVMLVVGLPHSPHVR